MAQKPDKKIESLINELPDAESAHLFFERLQSEYKRVAEKLTKQEGLLADILAIAAYSPLLSTTILQHPDYINWLVRERNDVRVKTKEELLESLARFALMNSQVDTHTLLSRFRRRELLRIYLRDIRKTNTLVEITEELSNLADTILEHALGISQQNLDNLFGQPQTTDEKGRTARASFSIVALGKHGSCELNYASDIDLMFLYSEDGVTSGHGTRGETTNRQYFVKLVEAITKLVGQPTGEGAAYRVDLRLRPYGRDGVLASSLKEAVNYYRDKAQAWERQALIRARSAAGDVELFRAFFHQVENRVYVADVTVAEALGHVRLSKQKIDRQHAHDREGFNVKLGRGGIREIEFIAQALQLAFGGRDEWLRSPHTLHSLWRLAERNLITERERMELFSAYDFLRKLEHRLQMENGLQTHSVSDDESKRLLVAMRMGFQDLMNFNRELETHTFNVHQTFERVFGKDVVETKTEIKITEQINIEGLVKSSPLIEPVNFEESALISSAKKLSVCFPSKSETEVLDLIRVLTSNALNPKRAITLLSRIATSLDKSECDFEIDESQTETLIKLCGVSEHFGEMISANPVLIETLSDNIKNNRDSGFNICSNPSSVTNGSDLANDMASLRREWAKEILAIGTLDALGLIEMRSANRLQTELAECSIETALATAKREMERRYGKAQNDFHLAVFGLGRLGGRGMDYGSDLDLVLVYDDEADSPFSNLTLKETYSRLTEIFVAVLSNLTREGSVYRVDLRLRPDGKNGDLSSGANSFLNYLEHRAVAWEWLAYVKLRFAVGDKILGERIEHSARNIIHESARKFSVDVLSEETKRVRERLELEKTKRRGSGFSFDIKYSAGGMLDVYFAVRYLQLRDDVRDEREIRSTTNMIEKLFIAGSLDENSYKAFRDGYAFLRELDHNLRLIVGRSSRLSSIEHPALNDIAKRMKISSSHELVEILQTCMKNIREAYKTVLGAK